jgi:hypothetical protein
MLIMCPQYPLLFYYINNLLIPFLTLLCSDVGQGNNIRRSYYFVNLHHSIRFGIGGNTYQMIFICCITDLLWLSDQKRPISVLVSDAIRKKKSYRFQAYVGIYIPYTYNENIATQIGIAFILSYQL